MTVALVLAAQPDAGLRGQLAALGVRQVDAAERAGPGLLTVAAAARAAGERVLICVGDDSLPEEVLARLLGAGRTAAFTGTGNGAGTGTGNRNGSQAPETQAAHRAAYSGGGALVVYPSDLAALEDAAESLARRRAAPAELGVLLGELSERGVGIRVLDAGPEGDGVVARWIVGPVARDVARWAAGRQLAPAALLGISLGLALLAATWFSEPATRAQVLASAALLVSFTVALAAVQLTVAERPGPAVGWLAAAGGMLTEFAVYAALAVSSGQATQNDPIGLDGIFGGSLRNTFVATWGGGGQVGVWRLAVAVILLFGARRLAEECYEAVARASGKILPRPPRRLIGQVITLPAGERVAVIAVTAICFGPRLTFLVLLAWGAVAAGYILASQIAGAVKLAAAGKLERARGVLPAYRGDGPIAYRIGGVVQGQLPPLPPLLVGLLVTCDLAFLGVADLSGLLIFGPVLAMLLAAVVLRHADLAYRARAGWGIPDDKYGLGWDGRILLAGFAALLGIVPFAYAVLAAWLWLLAGRDFLGGWLDATD